MGPETDTARRAVEAAGLATVVRFAGRVPDDELDALFAGAAVLVNPSVREGFGLVVAEAAAHGTPSVVVAGDDNAAAELVSTARTASSRHPSTRKCSAQRSPAPCWAASAAPFDVGVVRS